jgi:zinc protease
MDEGMSARLETRLVREQRIATAVNSGYDAFDRGDTLFVVTAIPAPGKSMVELEAALLAEIEKLKTESISAADLQRVYAGYLSDDVFQRDSIQSQANSIGVLESSGYSWQLQDDWPQKLKAIVPDQVRQAAKTFLVPSRRSILQLLPVEVAP